MYIVYIGESTSYFIKLEQGLITVTGLRDRDPHPPIRPVMYSELDYSKSFFHILTTRRK
jgi:hypothetical protein